MIKNKIKILTSEEYREIANLPTHIIAIIKPDGTFYKVNEEANPLLGWEPEEAIGEPMAKFIHPDDLDEALGMVGGLFLGTRALVTDFRIRCLHKEGGYRWISWTIKAKGGLVYGLGFDVTDKVEFEEALTLQSLILESISEGVTIADQNGKIVYINTAAEKLYGYDSGELLGQAMFKLSGLPKEISKMKVGLALSEINESGLWIGEWENVCKDGKKLTTACRVTTLNLKSESYFVSVQRDITKYKQEHDEQQELQNRFKTFFEQSTLPMEIYDLEGNPLEVNHAWEKLFETTKDQLKGYNILTDPSSKSTGIYDYVVRAYAGEEVEVPAFRMDPKDLNRAGRARWLEAWFSPVKDNSGKVRELAMILKDVTETRETQEALIQSNLERKDAQERFMMISERLSLAVRVGKIGIWEWVPGSDVVSWDETTHEIFGFLPGKFPGTSEAYTQSLYPDDREKVWNKIADSLKNKNSYLLDHRIIRADGTIRWVQSSGMAFYNLQGTPYQMMGTILDITERKQAQNDQRFLAEASDLLSSSFNYKENIHRLCENASRYFCDGCLMDQLHHDGSIERIVVVHPDASVRLNLLRSNQKSPHRYESDHPLFTALVTGKTVFNEDISDLKDKDGAEGESFYKELESAKCHSSIVTRLKVRESLLGTITFFTMKGTHSEFSKRHLWLAEELAYRISMALENSLLYLNSQEAIRSRDEFLSIASHELKTPLTSLTLQNQMRRRQIEKGFHETLEAEKMLKYLEADSKQLIRINRLIDDMLDIARIRARRLTIQKEPIDFSNFVKDVVERLRPQLEASGSQVTLGLIPDVVVEGDSYRLEQVLVNVLTNAMKYGAGKPVKVEIQVFPRKVQLLVHDRGPGIAQVDFERIFQRFERAVSSSEVSGLGLGLYISRQIMEQHNGSLTLTSVLGAGSTFRMELPLPLEND